LVAQPTVVVSSQTASRHEMVRLTRDMNDSESIEQPT
jgi:hypothetical protein